MRSPTDMETLEIEGEANGLRSVSHCAALLAHQRTGKMGGWHCQEASDSTFEKSPSQQGSLLILENITKHMTTLFHTECPLIKIEHDVPTVKS